jgi:hypothetical protein
VSSARTETSRRTKAQLIVMSFAVPSPASDGEVPIFVRFPLIYLPMVQCQVLKRSPEARVNGGGSSYGAEPSSAASPI